MADRYWVGGTAAWDGTAGTKWALTSGGAGGQAVPTAADDVFFDGASGAVTCTISGSRVAKSVNCTGFTGTLAGSGQLTISGSLTLSAGMTVTNTGTYIFNGTGTITTNGKTLTNGISVNGAGITVTLGDALNTNGVLDVVSGTFTTSASNYSVTATRLTSSTTTARTISLNGSTVTLSFATTTIDFTTSTNLTFNAGTSQINLTGSGPEIIGGGRTFYNVSCTSTTASTSTGLINSEISSSNVFNNLTFASPSSGVLGAIFYANQTINGTLTATGSSITQRNFLTSGTLGSPITLTVATLAADNCDFRDITLAGAASGSSPANAGNCGGNSNITFPAAKTVYWNLAGSQSWNSTGWATTASGSPSLANFPLPQDTATFTNSGSAGTIAWNNVYNFPAIDASARTSAATFNVNYVLTSYGSFNVGSGITFSGSSSQTYSGRSTMTFTTAGQSIPFAIFVNCGSSTFQLGSAVTSSSGITLTSGTFSASTYNLTCRDFVSANTNTRTINMSSGTWTLTGTGTVWNFATVTGLTFNKDTANILLSNTTTTARTFAGGGLTYNKLTIGGATGTSTLTFTGSNTFSELASTKTVAHTLSFTAGTTQTVGAWTITGTVGNVVTIQSATAASHTLTKTGGGIVSANYLSISRSTATPSNTWYAGANSTDGGNNSGWIFSAAPSTATGNMFFMFS